MPFDDGPEVLGCGDGFEAVTDVVQLKVVLAVAVQGFATEPHPTRQHCADGAAVVRLDGVDVVLAGMLAELVGDLLQQRPRCGS